MNIKNARRYSTLFPVACLAAGTLASVSIRAQDQLVDVVKTVTTAGLDVSQPAGAQKLYFRLVHAANLVCGRGLRVGLEPVQDFHSCEERSIGDAVRSARLPQLTMIYLKTHTLQEAANQRIETPVVIADHIRPTGQL
jgi:UrcA family protein